MKVQTVWNEKMQFTASDGGHSIPLDAKRPLGEDAGLLPKQALLAAVSGCTAMDVIALLRKFKQPVDSFRVDAEGETTEGGHPVVFKEIRLRFLLEGAIDPAKALEAVRLSQTRYCGVTAMVCKAVPIRYTVHLGGQEIGAGQAEFSA
ncbi:MAG: OsmC family protein [Bdellovibrionales bacterium]|nr:OsmC family protein [Bdellovibrionales bacterium]